MQSIVFANSKKDIRERLEKITKQVDTFFFETAEQNGFENREGQQDMALDICQAWEYKEHILIEAGVGIGKSFAYIVPMLYYHRLFHETIVIATSTIALQEQLVNDINKIEELINYKPRVILAKGQSHFICKKRAQEYVDGTKIHEERTIVEKILQTAGLENKERAEFPFDINNRLWSKVNVQEYNPKICSTDCKERFSCYYLKLRSVLQDTGGIIICNQNLLTMDRLKKDRDQKRLFPENVPIIIIDEAHNLENKVRDALTESLTKYEIKRDLLDAVRTVHDRWTNIKKYVDEVLPLIDIFFKNIDQQIDCFISADNGREMERFPINTQIQELNRISKLLYSIWDKAQINYGMDDWKRNKSDSGIIDRLQDLSVFFNSLTLINSNFIFWVERKKQNITIFRCPKNMNSEIQRLYFSDPDTLTILTSATICTQNSGQPEDQYSYFISNTGFPFEDNGYLADPKPSPFDYDNHAMIYYNEDLPHPTKDREHFIEESVKVIAKLLDISKGKALILFTAKSDLDIVYHKLSELSLPYNLIIQNDDSSQSELLQQFKIDTDSVLLGTGVFWEGISIEGESLSNLIIFRLPFPVPEPIIEYKCSKSKNKVMEVLVPEMILKLKQGIGRLIRNYTDKGIVSILDSRLGDKSKSEYKSLVWDALPIKNKTNSISELEEFYKKLYS